MQKLGACTKASTNQRAYICDVTGIKVSTSCPKLRCELQLKDLELVSVLDLNLLENVWTPVTFVIGPLQMALRRGQSDSNVIYIIIIMYILDSKVNPGCCTEDGQHVHTYSAIVEEAPGKSHRQTSLWPYTSCIPSVPSRAHQNNFIPDCQVPEAYLRCSTRLCYLL